MQSDGSQNSEFWGICCEGGKKYSQVVRQRFHITMAALDPTVVPTSPVVSLMVDRGGCEYLICSLKPGSVLQVNLNLYFDKGEKVTFSLRGQGKIHLSGYHIYGANEPAPSVAAKSCNAISPKKLAKEVNAKKELNSPNKAEKVKSVKFDTPSKQEGKKKQDSKNASPNMNAQSPKKVPVKAKEESDDSDDDDSDDDEDSEDEEEATGEDSNRLLSYKRSWSSLTQSDDEDETDSSDSDEDDEEAEKPAKEFQNKKKIIKLSSTPVSNQSGNVTPKNATKVLHLNEKITPKSNDALNSSAGRTPMPQKKTHKVNLNKASADKPSVSKKVSFPDSDSDDSDDDNKNSSMDTSLPNEKKQLDESNSLSASKKKKKKKKLSADLNASNVSASSESGDSKKPGGLSAASFSKKHPEGLQFEDIRNGNGPVAKKGKIVHVYYIGRLENNKVFDSCKSDGKPFSFKLGVGQVIKGWDLGIEGMQVGGKRRLKIPAELGYKNKKMGPIPPNSTLYFIVELKAVS